MACHTEINVISKDAAYIYLDAIEFETFSLNPRRSIVTSWPILRTKKPKGGNKLDFIFTLKRIGPCMCRTIDHEI